MNIPRAIKTCRMARGISQQELAQRIEISPSYLSLLEAGKKDPSVPMLRDLAEGLEMSLDLLMLTAIDYSEVRRGHAELAELFGQMLVALASDSR
jgi:transcriptional regulator with XRE-family HTH domain